MSPPRTTTSTSAAAVAETRRSAAKKLRDLADEIACGQVTNFQFDCRPLLNEDTGARTLRWELWAERPR